MKAELKCREFEAYQSVYCGLCREVGQRYGWLPRMMLNYDFVFLAMLLSGPQDETVEELHRCPACPLRKKRMCVGSKGIAQAADQMVVLSWWKLKDNVRDNGFLRGLPARLLLILLKKSYRKASNKALAFDDAAKKGLEHLHEYEDKREASIDRPADAFARILMSAAAGTENDQERRAMEQLLYHLGRWIYLIDAVDDLEEDSGTGNYNPIVLRFPEESGRNEYLHTTLLHSLNLSRGAFELLPKTRWSEIIANILYLGLPMVEKAVFSGQWKEIKKLTVRRN